MCAWSDGWLYADSEKDFGDLLQRDSKNVLYEELSFIKKSS